MREAELGKIDVFVVAEVRLYEQGLAQVLARDGRYRWRSVPAYPDSR